MARRNLLTTLRRTLARHGITAQTQDDGAVGFLLHGEHGTYELRAGIAEGRVVVVRAVLGMRVPPERLGEVAEWVLRRNGELHLGSFELGLDDGTVRVRASLDAEALDARTLGQMLPTLWTSCAETLDAAALDLMAVMFGDEQPAGPADLDAAGEDPVEALYDLLVESVGRACGSDVASPLSGTLYNLAATFLDQLADGERVGAMVRVALEGDVEEAAITLSAEDAPPLRLRFQPMAIREREARDRQGLVLYHHAAADTADTLLTGGFADAVHELADDYGLTEEGYPLDIAQTRTTGVLLTDAPLPLDDRAPHSRLVRIDWQGGAPGLGEYERVHTAYFDGEAVAGSSPIRRWHVPATVLNAAVAAGQAAVTLLDDGW